MNTLLTLFLLAPMHRWVIVSSTRHVVGDAARAIGNLFRDNTDEVDPRERGRESETEILEELGLDKNTEKVSSDEGNSIPDAQTDDEMVEIKDSKRASRTRQIRIQQQAAAESGREHTVITGENTKVSRPLSESSKVVRRPDIGPQ